MTNQLPIVEKLSLFNNMSFTKKQWDIILKGCGCPKSSHFWSALRANNLQRNKRLYTLIDVNQESFGEIWTKYCLSNRANVKKSYLRKKINSKEKKEINITLYMVDGYLTTDKPIKE